MPTSAAVPNLLPVDVLYVGTMEVAPAIVLLARRACGGDAAALNELLAELRPLVVRTARLVVGSGSWAAEDAAQEALLDMSRGISRLRDPAAVRTWALRVAIRRALKVARRERLLRVRNAATVEGWQEPAPSEGREAALKQAFDSLAPRLRATAVLRLLAGLTEDETADTLGCSVGAVKSNLHDARKRLTRLLSDAGYAPTVEQRKENSDDRP
jgi:RNA polymerase sigma-70 factor (ECF subfamily)